MTKSHLFDVLTLSSFLAMWMATAFLLKEYQYKIGRSKFLFHSEPASDLLYLSVSSLFWRYIFFLFAIVTCTNKCSYIMIFSATRQIGALLFGLALWTASSLVYDPRVRQSLLISAVGMSALFCAVEISPVRYHIFPPFGLITEAFLPLGAMLLSIGIYTSAKKISQNSDLRKEFYNIASSQLSLLKAIGVSQMQKEFEKKIKSVEERVSIYEPEQNYLSDENAKEILREVLTELDLKAKQKKQQ